MAHPQINPPSDPHSPWSDSPAAAYLQAKATATARQNAHLQSLKVYRMNAWTRTWKGYQNRTVKKNRLKVAHILLKKAESTTIATQIRDRENWAWPIFLHRRRVPGITFPGLPLRVAHRQETPKHVINVLQPHQRVGTSCLREAGDEQLCMYEYRVAHRITKITQGPNRLV